MRKAGIGLLALCGLAGQDAPQATPPAAVSEGAATRILLNEGRPLTVPFQCTNDDLQWAGLSCSEDEPCPMYLEIAALEAVGNRILAAGNIHSADATLYSVLLSSDDAGKSWQEPYERLRGASLDHIQFLDFETGWIGGQTVQPLPGDPFLLVTSDGGKTWRRRPLFSEPRSGVILQFWFSSRSNGSLVLDRGQGGDLSRYELLETPNGGETWMFRESNERLIRLKRSAAGNPDWRVRPDSTTKAFALERRQGEKWARMASFSIGLASCKPPRPEPSEPAPEEPAAPPPSPPAPPAKPPTLKRP